MTVIKKCQLIWRGKSEAKGIGIEKPHSLKVVESINTTKSSEGWSNKLILGENKLVIASLLRKFAGKINVIYIDPPFASGTTFKPSKKSGKTQENPTRHSLYNMENGFKDTWGIRGLEAYLNFMYQRLVLMAELLADKGSIFVHLDWHAVHYIKVILDEIFSYENFRADIIWQRTPGHHLSSTLDVMTDVILWYSKTADYVYHQQYQALTEKEIKEKFPYIEKETGRKFTHEKLEQSSNAYSIGEKRIINGREVTTKVGWRWTQETFDKRLAKNPHLIYWTVKGRPRYKRYADEYLGRKIGNLWTDIQALTSNEKERIGYPTQKPEALLQRIIRMTSNEGDLVADFFCGSGTTLSVAEKLNRRWIGGDSSKYATSVTKNRLMNIKKEPKPFEILTIN